jgi:hypothetical protein
MEQALAHSSGENAHAAAAHRAEWERRRQMLHAQLLQQDQQILGELQATQSKVAAAAGSAEAEFAHSRQLHDQLQAERSGLARSEQELTAKRAVAASNKQQADASRAELASLTAELERMERTLADLKAARQRQQQVYSLVPYRGKRGDNRKPLYIECTGDEVIFHPDHLALHRLTLTPSAIRDEIERRLKAATASDALAAKGLTPSSDAPAKKPEENAYLLMLIRPNGITTYYQTLAALKGLRTDFGYEFIDQDWILDFSEDENAPQKQPWLAADQTKDRQPSGVAGKDNEASTHAGAGQKQRRYQGLPSGATLLGRPMGILSAEESGPTNSSFGSGGDDASRQGDSPGTGPATGSQPAIPGGVTGSGRGTGDGKGSSLSGLLAKGKGPSAAPEASLDGNLTSGLRQPSGQSDPPNTISGLPQPPGQSDPSNVASGAAKGPVSAPSISGGQHGTSDPAADNRAAQSNGMAERQTEPSSSNETKPGIEAPPGLLPSFAPNRPGTATSPGTAASPQQSAGSAGRGNAADGQPGSSEPPRAMAGAIPLRPTPFIGNRDWIIVIECTSDALVMRTTGQRIATSELSRGDTSNNLLLELVQRMIARRQAAVRPGDPPYRPMIRFRVWPEGLRSYHLAYPALEALHVPMSRENLDSEP